jgi:AraC-like DNA-binding protein
MKDQLGAAKAYIDEHLTEDLTLDALAAVAAYSRHHFSRAFKEEFGVSTSNRISIARSVPTCPYAPEKYNCMEALRSFAVGPITIS